MKRQPLQQASCPVHGVRKGQGWPSGCPVVRLPSPFGAGRRPLLSQQSQSTFQLWGLRRTWRGPEVRVSLLRVGSPIGPHRARKLVTGDRSRTASAGQQRPRPRRGAGRAYGAGNGSRAGRLRQRRPAGGHRSSISDDARLQCTQQLVGPFAAKAPCASVYMYLQGVHVFTRSTPLGTTTSLWRLRASVSLVFPIQVRTGKAQEDLRTPTHY
eukprot:scaffold1414_cov384-Prasinococcus_capsulatus_cf.AAC.9